MGVVERLASRVFEMTGKLDSIAERGLNDWVVELAALHALQVQAQALLGMMVRIASRLGYSPESPGEAARLLADEGLLAGDDLDFARRLIGFRNILVHEYERIDMELVRRILEAREYRRVAALAARLLEEARRRGLDP